MTMSVSANNLAAFRNSIAREKEKIFNEIEDRLFDIGFELIKAAINSKIWSGFTGNAQTGFAIGVYRDGALKSYETGADFNRPPLRKKIKKGQRLYLKNPYEGKKRIVYGTVDVTDETAPETSERFIKSFRPSITKGVSMVMCIGAEYYAYIDPHLYALETTRNVVAPHLVWKRIELGMQTK